MAHQSSGPAVGGDISLVHFVNREIVCSESGWVWVTRKDRHAEKEEAYEDDEKSTVLFH